MPQPPSGDPGQGHGEHDPTDDPIEFRPPLPPEDRIWRHPSEVAASAARPEQVTAGVTPPPPPVTGRHTLALAASAALIGATLSVGVIAAVGGFDTETRVVERQVAIQPVTSMADDGTRAISERTAPSVAGVYVSGDDGRHDGTAIVIRSDGHLLTTASLVAGADTIHVRLPDWPMMPAEVVGVDQDTDLAVLRVDADDLRPAAMGTADGVRVGHDALVVGHTDGGSWTESIERTMVSALDRRLRTPDGTVLHGMMLLGAPLATEDGGSPLLDETGAVIGITTGIPATEGVDDDTPFGVATPIDLAVHAADQIIEYGHVRHVWLGIEGVDLPADAAAAMGVAGGADVATVVADSPASQAGIAAGDVVVGVDGSDVASMSHLISELRAREPGEEVVIHVRRGDEDLDMRAELVERD